MEFSLASGRSQFDAELCTFCNFILVCVSTVVNGYDKISKESAEKHYSIGFWYAPISSSATII